MKEPEFWSLLRLANVFISDISANFYLQCFHVPYSALTMFISSEQAERDSATAYSEYRRRCVTHQHPVLSQMAKLPLALPSDQG